MEISWGWLNKDSEIKIDMNIERGTLSMDFHFNMKIDFQNTVKIASSHVWSIFLRGIVVNSFL